MFLLVPAHPGFPGQIPQSRKTVVCVCVCIWVFGVKESIEIIFRVKKVAGNCEFQDGRQNGCHTLSGSLSRFIINKNKLGVFSMVLGVRDFTQIIHFARRVMHHC